MTTKILASILLLTACTPTYADPKPRCGPGGPPGARCGPPAQPPPADLVHPSVTTVVSTMIDGRLVRAVAGRGKHGAFVTLEKIEDDKVASRTAIRFEGVADATSLDVIQLVWRTDRHGALVFHLGAGIGGWICHVERGESLAKCVIARGGGRPSN